MTVPEVPPPGSTPQPDSAPKRGLGGVVTVLLVLVGVVLLLPGLCSLLAMRLLGGGGGALGLIYLLTFAVAAGGVMLIRYAVRNR
jgi:hypothetical protein